MTLLHFTIHTANMAPLKTPDGNNSQQRDLSGSVLRMKRPMVTDSLCLVAL